MQGDASGVPGELREIFEGGAMMMFAVRSMMIACRRVAVTRRWMIVAKRF
jgi:hypothetical protein